LWKEQGFQQMKICLQRTVVECTCLKEEAAAAFAKRCGLCCGLVLSVVGCRGSCAAFDFRCVVSKRKKGSHVVDRLGLEMQ
jgi:hypothetical protein